MAKRVKFTNAEIEQYFDRICVPKCRRVYDVSSLDDGKKLEFLNLMQKHHLCKVPWDNLTQHYSWHHTVHLAPSHLFDKIVRNEGRGGYCMEANFFHHLILYTLGFQVFMAGSRIHKPDLGGYGGWTHVVNIVTIGGTRYLLDGGYGPQGPSRPLPIEHGIDQVQIAPARMRVMWESIPDNLDQSKKVWVCQYRINKDAEWRPIYCFVDFEFTPADVGSMNFAPLMNRQTFFTHKVVDVRFTTDRETDSGDGPGSPGEAELEGEINGTMTLNHSTLKWRKEGKTIVSLFFKKDSERVAALKKYFGVVLTKDETDAIFNTAAMIGGGAMEQED